MNSFSKINKVFKREIKGWKIWEMLWLLLSAAVIAGLSVFWGDNLIGITAAVSGVCYVVLTGKGKPSAYIFGVVNVLLYAWISFGARYYGEVMLNIIYYLPMNFVGWHLWRKNMDSSTGEVKKKKLSQKSAGLLFAGTIAAIILYGELLRSLGGNMAYMDSMSTVISVVAQILCVKRYMEQWILWIVVDVVTIAMWIFAFFNGTGSVSTLIMWSLYLINGVIIYFRWKNELNREAKDSEYKIPVFSEKKEKLSLYEDVT